MPIQSQRDFSAARAKSVRTAGTLHAPRAFASLSRQWLCLAAVGGAAAFAALPVQQAAAQAAAPTAQTAPSGTLTIPAAPAAQRTPAFPGALPRGAGGTAGSGAGSANAQAAPIDPLAVARELTGAEPLMPARGIGQTSYWTANRDWLLPVLIVAVLALAGIALYLRKRARRPVPVDQTARALRRIEDAAAESDDKHFASAVSDAVRQYLEARFHLRAPEQTTEEFLTDVRAARRLPVPAIGLLATLLELADLAKFARHGLGAQQRGQMSQCARELINLLSAPAATQPATGTPQPQQQQQQDAAEKSA